MPTALCTGNAAWPVATQAGLQSIDTPFSSRTVPVEHRSAGTYVIVAASYPDGLLLIPTDSDPAGNPLVPPAVVTAESSSTVTLDPEDLEDFGHGVAARFA